MIQTDLHPVHFGTEHDPVLTGVANGLHELFPPIHNAGRIDIEGGPTGDAVTDDHGALSQG